MGGELWCRRAVDAVDPAPSSPPAAALFGTAWPYEGDCGRGAAPCWHARDARFWDRIERAWLGSSGSGGGRPLAWELPLRSDFSVGSGRGLYQGGRLLCGRPWYNLSLQGLQPTLARMGGVGSIAAEV